jgi:hypothetical protein
VRFGGAVQRQPGFILFIPIYQYRFHTSSRVETPSGKPGNRLNHPMRGSSIQFPLAALIFPSCLESKTQKE